jgi:hypothetical protein
LFWKGGETSCNPTGKQPSRMNQSRTSPT